MLRHKTKPFMYVLSSEDYNCEQRDVCNCLTDRLTWSRRCILQITAQVTTFLTAGYETTASTLACTIYNISATPAAEEKLLQEIDGFGRNFVPTYEDLDKVGRAVLAVSHPRDQSC